MEEWEGTWVALVSDEGLDTLNAELAMLHNDTHALMGGTGLRGGPTGLGGNATVSILPPDIICCCSFPERADYVLAAVLCTPGSCQSSQMGKL